MFYKPVGWLFLNLLTSSLRAKLLLLGLKVFILPEGMWLWSGSWGLRVRQCGSPGDGEQSCDWTSWYKLLGLALVWWAGQLCLDIW